MQSILPQPISWRSILILFSHLLLGRPRGLFPSGFSTKPCICLSSIPHVLHDPPLSFFSICSSEQYWVRSTDTPRVIIKIYKAIIYAKKLGFYSSLQLLFRVFRWRTSFKWLHLCTESSIRCTSHNTRWLHLALWVQYRASDALFTIHDGYIAAKIHFCALKHSINNTNGLSVQGWALII
jgi:hypothetical protein